MARQGMEDRLVELGEYIRSQREVARISVRRLAELAEVSNPYVSQIERGLRKPSADVLQQIAKALHISSESLYVRAGILDPDRVSAVSVVDAVRGDPHLGPKQKQALLRLYEQLRAEAAEGMGGAEGGRSAGEVGMPRRRGRLS